MGIEADGPHSRNERGVVRFNREISVGHILQLVLMASAFIYWLWGGANSFADLRRDVLELHQTIAELRNSLAPLPDMHARLDADETHLHALDQRDDAIEARARADEQMIYQQGAAISAIGQASAVHRR